MHARVCTSGHTRKDKAYRYVIDEEKPEFPTRFDLLLPLLLLLLLLLLQFWSLSTLAVMPRVLGYPESGLSYTPC